MDIIDENFISNVYTLNNDDLTHDIHDKLINLYLSFTQNKRYHLIENIEKKGFDKFFEAPWSAYLRCKNWVFD